MRRYVACSGQICTRTANRRRYAGTHLCGRHDVTGESSRGGLRDRAIVGLEKKVVLEMSYINIYIYLYIYIYIYLYIYISLYIYLYGLLLKCLVWRITQTDEQIPSIKHEQYELLMWKVLFEYTKKRLNVYRNVLKSKLTTLVSLGKMGYI